MGAWELSVGSGCLPGKVLVVGVLRRWSPQGEWVSHLQPRTQRVKAGLEGRAFSSHYETYRYPLHGKVTHTDSRSLWPAEFQVALWIQVSQSQDSLWADWPHLSSVTCWWAEWPCPLELYPQQGWEWKGGGGGGFQEPLPSTQPAESKTAPRLQASAWDRPQWLDVSRFLLPPPTFPSRQPRSRGTGVLPGVRTWPAPRPAPGAVPAAAPLAPTAGCRVPPAICSELSLDPASSPAQRDFWHLGHRRQGRGRATQGGGRGGRGPATGIGPAWGGGGSLLRSWLPVGQGSRWGE